MATYSDFEVLTESYKEVNGHKILTNVHIPKPAREGQFPVIINWHGGGLFTGHREFAPFMNAWLPQWAHSHSAIIITSDYRLLPESNASDILSDLRSLWDWVHSTLPSILQTHFKSSVHCADLSRIALVGGSAGGYCAVQQALDHPSEVRVVLLAYPLLDLESDFMAKGIGVTEILGMTPPPKAEVEERLRNLKPGSIVTMGGFERWMPVGIGIYAGGLLPQVMGDAKDVLPFRRIREGASLPKKVLLIQGTEDSAVPFEGSKSFAKLVREQCPGTQIRDEYFEGMEHGFDHDATLNDKWAADGLKWVEDVWLDA